MRFLIAYSNFLFSMKNGVVAPVDYSFTFAVAPDGRRIKG